ncbi:hypothetical protein [Nonomuraea sp. NPDC049784]|uniref:hypothetical protein n=1 Tax=Nonomuraea sp. NPDC049784 TaxID=3154361 RepID=UPI0033CD1475
MSLRSDSAPGLAVRADLIDIETARAVADTVIGLNDHLADGGGNIIRTDEHAAQLRERAEFLGKRAAFAARPIGDRLRANAVRLRDLADAHDRTRITLKDAT